MSPAVRIALALTLIAYPAYRAFEPQFYITGEAQDWWCFWGLAAVGHWSCFALVAWALRSHGEGWKSLGLDTGFFVRHRRWFIGAGVVLVAAVMAASGLGPAATPRQGLFPLQATTLPERLFMILGAIVTAGVVEEVVFRGFAITYLGRLLGSPWRALPFSMVSFFFLHGTPSDPGRIVGILIVGLVFGSAFILMRCRRLEWLILIHGALNLPLIFML